MAKQVTLYDLLISCPLNVIKELEIIKETVSSFNQLQKTEKELNGK